MSPLLRDSKERIARHERGWDGACRANGLQGRERGGLQERIPDGQGAKLGIFSGGGGMQRNRGTWTCCLGVMSV
eukprot:775656-Rhodomonas_salina.3